MITVGGCSMVRRTAVTDSKYVVDSLIGTYIIPETKGSNDEPCEIVISNPIELPTVKGVHRSLELSMYASHVGDWSTSEIIYEFCFTRKSVQ